MSGGELFAALDAASSCHQQHHTTLGSWLEQVSDSPPPAATPPSAGRSSPSCSVSVGAGWKSRGNGAEVTDCSLHGGRWLPDLWVGPQAVFPEGRGGDGWPLGLRCPL